MMNKTTNLMESPRTRSFVDDDEPEKCAAMVNSLPPGFVMTEWAVGMLRAELNRAGLGHYQICHASDLDLEDAEQNLEALGETGASWRALPTAMANGEALTALTHGPTTAKIWPTGVLHLPRHQAVLARWYWVDENQFFRSLWLVAVPNAAAYVTLRDAVRRNRRRRCARHWQIIRNSWQSSEFLPRECGPDIAARLVLSDEMRRRVDAEIINFFKPQVAELYAGLKIPYRRGVLLHGAPGNGKTSLIRAVGAALPEMPMLVLRPSSRFNTDSLHFVLKRWSAIAPAVLVIEDLDWLLKQVNISAFLNAVDGIDSAREFTDDVNVPATGWHAEPRANAKSEGQGLLLLATTNHPEQLDPAINNRPGRFDVVMEVPMPSRDLRRAFFAQRLEDVEDALLDQLSDKTDGFSFAHLQEVIGASGLAAIHDNRADRTADDLLAAVTRVRAADESAARGFIGKPTVPFGLSPRPKHG